MALGMIQSTGGKWYEGLARVCPRARLRPSFLALHKKEIRNRQRIECQVRADRTVEDILFPNARVALLINTLVQPKPPHLTIQKQWIGEFWSQEAGNLQEISQGPFNSLFSCIIRRIGYLPYIIRNHLMCIYNVNKAK